MSFVGYAAGTGTVEWQWDCPAECNYCVVYTSDPSPHPTAQPIPQPTTVTPGPTRTVDPTPSPSPLPTPEPSLHPSPQPSATPTHNPTMTDPAGDYLDAPCSYTDVSSEWSRQLHRHPVSKAGGRNMLVTTIPAGKRGVLIVTDFGREDVALLL